MRKPEAPFSPFGNFFSALCLRAGTTPYAVGLAVGIRSRSRMAYAMRSDEHQRRYTTLKFEMLVALAKAVHASPDETSELILLGLKQHAHPRLRQYIAALERDNAKMRHKLKRGPMNYRPTEGD